MRWARYGVEWVGLTLTLLGLSLVIPALAAPPARAVAVRWGILATAVAIFPVYGILAQALLRPPREFFTWWSASLGYKFLVFGALLGTVLGLGWLESRAFLLSVAASFAFFLFHQVARLPRRAKDCGDSSDGPRAAQVDPRP